MKADKFTDIETLQMLAHYCRRIESIVTASNNDFDIFIQDENKIDAMALNVIQLGERINSNLSDEFKNKYTNIPWKNYTAMRNKLAHAYFELDEEILWDSAITDIPVLYEFCIAQLAEEGLEIPSAISKNAEVK